MTLCLCGIFLSTSTYGISCTAVHLNDFVFDFHTFCLTHLSCVCACKPALLLLDEVRALGAKVDAVHGDLGAKVEAQHKQNMEAHDVHDDHLTTLVAKQPLSPPITVARPASVTPQPTPTPTPVRPTPVSPSPVSPKPTPKPSSTPVSPTPVSPDVNALESECEWFAKDTNRTSTPVPQQELKVNLWKSYENSYGQYLIGKCHYYGWGGINKDTKEAVRLYGLSAAQGHASAQNNLGVCYKNGQGVAKDLKEAVRLYGLSAAQGHAGAQNNLGYCYQNGEGVAKDLKGAVRLYAHITQF